MLENGGESDLIVGTSNPANDFGHWIGVMYKSKANETMGLSPKP